MSKIGSDVYSVSRKETVLQSGSLLRYLILLSADFLMGFLLAKTKVLSGFSPFGVSYAAAEKRKGITRIAGLLGVAAGYLLTPADSLYYLAATIGAAVLSGVSDKYFKEKFRLKAAFSAALPMIFFAVISQKSSLGFSLSAISFLALSVLSGGFAIFIHTARTTLEKKKYKRAEANTAELVSIIMIGCAFLLSFSGVSFYGINLANTLAALAVALSAYRGGFSYGCAAAAICGITLAAGNPANISILPGLLFGGLFAGFFSGGRMLAAAAMVSGGIISVLLQGLPPTSVYALYEIAAGAVIFTVIPSALLNRLYSYVYISKPEKHSLKHAKALKTLFVERLRQASGSFGDISKILENKTENPAVKSDISIAWNTAADKVCRRCAMASRCWGGMYNDTADVMNRLVAVYRNMGFLSRADFPDYFLLRCIKTDELLKELSRQFDDFSKQHRNYQKTAEQKRALASQYESIRNIMEVLAEDMEKTAGFDEYLEKRITDLLLKAGAKKAGSVCMLDNDGMMSVSLAAYGMEHPMDLKALERLVSEPARRSMQVTNSLYENGIFSAHLRDHERYAVKIARSCRKKRGEEFSGDSSSVFSPANGKYVFAISDGMGSGRTAARNSTMAVRFLERLMRAGFDRDSAFSLLNCAYLLRAEEEDFVTIDVAVINLVTGLCEFIKAGAASSFIKRRDKVIELDCKNAPVGILSDIEFEKNRQNLKTGDFLVMVSDGVCQCDTERITKVLMSYEGDDPEALASLLMSECALTDNQGRDDDITIAVGLLQSAV